MYEKYRSTPYLWKRRKDFLEGGFKTRNYFIKRKEVDTHRRGRGGEGLQNIQGVMDSSYCGM